MVLSIDIWERYNIGQSMLKLVMLSMMFSQLTRHSKLLMMCLQVMQYLCLMDTASTNQYIPSPCSVVSGQVHKDISIGNIIIVKNNGCIHRLLSDLEYMKAMSNKSVSLDSRTVCFDIKDRVFLMFDQDMLYFIPFKIHSGEKIIPSAVMTWQNG